MIYCEEVKGRFATEGSAYVIHYRTPLREGNKRFGSRAKATTFAVELLQELRIPRTNEQMIEHYRKELERIEKRFDN